MASFITSLFATRTVPFAVSLFVPLFIARRYLLSKRTLNFITVITAISVGGISLGVAALIIILSVFNGFQSLVERFLVGFDPHVRISAAVTAQTDGNSKGSQFLTNTDTLTNVILRACEPLAERTVGSKPVHVVASAVAGGKIVLMKSGANATFMQACQLYGIDTASIGLVSGIKHAVVAGEFALGDRSDGCIPLVMGIGLADKLRITTGDTLTLLAPSAIEAAITQATPPIMRKAIMVGLFQSNNKDYDAIQAYTSLDNARVLLGLPPNAALSIDLRCGDARLSNEAQQLINNALTNMPKAASYRVETWYDLHRDLYNVMRFERLAAFLILSIIILVAVFNIFASLSMTVAEKRAEIAVLKAMGASERLIVRIFFLQSVLVGLSGTLLGVGLALLLCWGQIRYGWLALDTSRYLIPAIPVIVQWSDVVLVALVAFVLALVAGFVPSRRAGAVRSAVSLLRSERV
jgi:lipoprotein-releasing system permease protein